MSRQNVSVNWRSMLTSLINMIGPVLEAAMQAQTMTQPPLI